MAMIEIMDDLHERVKEVVEKNPIEYASIRQFMNKAIKRELDHVNNTKTTTQE